jgi:hypothetical protein
MNMKRASLAALVLALSFAAAPISLATHVLGDTITGYLTAPPGAGRVVLDGHIYALRDGVVTPNELASFRVGQLVDLVLDGPANSSASRVMLIRAHVSN